MTPWDENALQLHTQSIPNSRQFIQAELSLSGIHDLTTSTLEHAHFHYVI